MVNRRLLIVFITLLIFGSGKVFSQSDFYGIDHVREVRLYFREKNWDHILDSLHEYFGEDGRLLGNVVIDGKKLYGVGVRYKGYSSFDPDVVKSPFNIDLEYTYNNQNYEGYTKLKLSNVIQDPSFVREVLSYEIVRKYMPASLANFANVYVNDTLLGLYTNVEAVDKNFADEHYGSREHSFFKGAPENLIIPDGQNANLNYYDDDTASYTPFYKLESDNPEEDWPNLVHFIDILNNDTANIDTILNIDRTLWMHALNYTLVNLDSYIGYCQNYYLYMDDYGRFNPIMWDFNMSFGSFKETDGITAPPSGLTIVKRKALDPLKMLSSTPMSPRPLIINLLRNHTYRRMFLAHMRTVINENFKNGLYLTRGLAIQNSIDTYVQNDTNKFYPYAQFHLNLDTTVGSGNNVFPGIRDLMLARVAYLDTFSGFTGAPEINVIKHYPEIPQREGTLNITAKVSAAAEVLLGYRYATNGVFKKIYMYDDGLHNDSVAGDGIYGANITASGTVVQYYIYAQNDSAGAFSPERAEYEFYSVQPQLAPGDVVINELMALNTGTAADQSNEYDAWVEIFNNTSENLNLKSIFLSDDLQNPTKWAFPDTVISAKGFLILWADRDTLQAGLHTVFALDENGGNLIISGSNNRIIDSIKYVLQIPGKTFGRYPNGYGNFTYMPPTFSAINLLGTTPTSDLLVYPNPASGNIYMELNNSDDFVSYKLYSSTGQKVISGDFGHGKTGPVLMEIDISKLHTGLYFLVLETSDEFLSRKIVITKQNY